MIKGDEIRTALERADKIINEMATYIGKMAIPAEAICDLNEHWLYIGRLRRQGDLPPAKRYGTKIYDVDTRRRLKGMNNR